MIEKSIVARTARLDFSRIFRKIRIRMYIAGKSRSYGQTKDLLLASPALLKSSIYALISWQKDATKSESSAFVPLSRIIVVSL